jgi:hypothetical protein
VRYDDSNERGRQPEPRSDTREETRAKFTRESLIDRASCRSGETCLLLVEAFQILSEDVEQQLLHQRFEHFVPRVDDHNHRELEHRGKITASSQCLTKTEQ